MCILLLSSPLPPVPVLLEPRPRWSQDPPPPRGSSNLHANVTAVSSPLYFVAATKPWHCPGTRVPAVHPFFLSRLPLLQFGKEGLKNPFPYSILSLGRFLTGNKNILLFYLFWKKHKQPELPLRHQLTFLYSRFVGILLVDAHLIFQELL